MTLWAAFSTAGGVEGQRVDITSVPPHSRQVSNSTSLHNAKAASFLSLPFDYHILICVVPCPVCAPPPSCRLAMWLLSPWVTSSIHAAGMVASGCLCPQPPVLYAGGQRSSLCLSSSSCAVLLGLDLIFMILRHKTALAIKPGCTKDCHLLCP